MRLVSFPVTARRDRCAADIGTGQNVVDLQRRPQPPIHMIACSGPEQRAARFSRQWTC